MHISAHNLSKTYSNGAVALKDVTFSVAPGQIHGLIGPNGAGKSTMISLLTGQLKPSQGYITIDEQKYLHVPDEFRGKIGVMSQDIILWEDLTVRENLHLAANFQKIPYPEKNGMIDLIIESLNLQTELQRVAKNLSGGFRRRLHLALSVLHRPSAIFLDEPSPGVDPLSRRALWEFIRTLRADGCSIILSDHYLDEAERLSDTFTILDEGSVVAQGTLHELQKKYGDGILITVHTGDAKKYTHIILAEYPHATITSDGFSVVAKAGITTMEAIIIFCKKNNIPVQDILFKEPSLEDIFLIITGKKVH